MGVSQSQPLQRVTLQPHQGVATKGGVLLVS